MPELQKVLISRVFGLQQANDEFKRITKKKPKMMKQTVKWYQYRYLPPTKFVPGSFKTIVVDKNIHLVFGDLKPEYGHLKGSGLFDYFKKGISAISNTVSNAKNYVSDKVSNAKNYVSDKVSNFVNEVTTINDFSTKAKDMLKKYGNSEIVSITVRRAPINPNLDLAFQLFSAGKWSDLKTKYGFDKFFHLSMIVTISPQFEKLNVEKLDVISINKDIELKEGSETIEVPLNGKHITLGGMINKTRQRMGDKDFFAYSALGGNNCQNFVSKLLDTEGLLGPTEKKFIYQDIKKLVEELPSFTKSVAQNVTNLSAVLNKYTGIGGKRGGAKKPKKAKLEEDVEEKKNENGR